MLVSGTLCKVVTESRGKSTNYRHLVRCGKKCINQQLKRNGLTTKNEGVTSILQSLEHQSAIFFC
jgi:hypothetical protein